MPTDSNILHLEVYVTGGDIFTGIKILLEKVCPKWDIKSVEFKVFTEGISNQLVGCFPGNGEPALLIRVYGAGTELFIDRDAERHTMIALASAGQGPPLIATFSNGLVYHYVPGTILSVETVKAAHIWPLVARRLGSMHRLRTKGSAILWMRLHCFIDLLPENLSDDPKLSRVDGLILDKNALKSEVTWLQGNLELTKNPIVFCHNDLLLANIVLNDDGDDVTFIDYEYAGPNYQAFDIANHFVEYAGVDDVDYSRLPALEDQKLWIKEYLKSFSKFSAPTISEINDLLSEVQKFTPVAHFHWTLWSMVQTIHSKINFNFADYAGIRFAEYKNTRSFVDIN